MKTLDDIAGYEYDWLVCDKSDQVALFSTAGIGYVPDVFLADTEVYDQAIDNILKSSTTTSTLIFPEIGDGLQNTWKQVAERGIYGYDADLTDGTYNLVSIPGSVIYVNELPSKIASVVKQYKLVDVLFDSKKSFTRSDFVSKL